MKGFIKKKEEDKINNFHDCFQFASRAKTIKNEAHINEVVSDTALLKRYLNKIKNLEKQVKEVGMVRSAVI